MFTATIAYEGNRIRGIHRPSILASPLFTYMNADKSVLTREAEKSRCAYRNPASSAHYRSARRRSPSRYIFGSRQWNPPARAGETADSIVGDGEKYRGAPTCMRRIGRCHYRMTMNRTRTRTPRSKDPSTRI